MKTLGTAACPPYHLAFVIGGTSAEANLKTVKLASTHYLDSLPTQGNDLGQAFRDVELEKALLEEAYGDDDVDLAVGPVSSGVALAMLPAVVAYRRHENQRAQVVQS